MSLPITKHHLLDNPGTPLLHLVHKTDLPYCTLSRGLHKTLDIVLAANTAVCRARIYNDGHAKKDNNRRPFDEAKARRRSTRRAAKFIQAERGRKEEVEEEEEVSWEKHDHNPNRQGGGGARARSASEKRKKLSREEHTGRMSRSSSREARARRQEEASSSFPPANLSPRSRALPPSFRPSFVLRSSFVRPPSPASARMCMALTRVGSRSGRRLRSGGTLAALP